jgi:hypothetical protein
MSFCCPSLAIQTNSHNHADGNLDALQLVRVQNGKRGTANEMAVHKSPEPGRVPGVIASEDNGNFSFPPIGFLRHPQKHAIARRPSGQSANKAPNLLFQLFRESASAHSPTLSAKTCPFPVTGTTLGHTTDKTEISPPLLSNGEVMRYKEPTQCIYCIALIISLSNQY